MPALDIPKAGSIPTVAIGIPALGRSNQEIARRLYISTNKVKFHLRAICERLGVSNRIEAARLAGRLL